MGPVVACIFSDMSTSVASRSLSKLSFKLIFLKRICTSDMNINDG